ncbi:MAG: glycosyltransferase [Candidatus Marinimicrobia bacterium]|nr:glycosyltransferase [Candidatus Neomarinimicrobiota bacterium]
MSTLIDSYTSITGPDVVEQLKQLAKPMQGMRVVHVNSTKEGGGVAEILHKMIPLMNDLGIETSWEVLEGNPEFYSCTKMMHNAIQGNQVPIPQMLLDAYEQTNFDNAERLRKKLEEADVVFIHDPQPAAFLGHMENRKGKWIWRCHIDASTPYRPVWKYLRQHIRNYDASVFSLANFAQALPHPIYLIPPSIDPLNDKNCELSDEEVNQVYSDFGIDPDRPLLVQVSRFDRFKDPIGVIEAFRKTKPFVPTLQLVLAGGGASDDPEGRAVLAEVQQAAQGESDIHILDLPGDAHRTINALQRAATIVVQKSLREGFGLTVTEGMWKQKPVIGGDTGGIRLQVVNHHTGFLVNSPEGAALRIRYLMRNQGKLLEMGLKAKAFVKENFLITRHLREYLTLMLSLRSTAKDRIYLDY